MKKLISKIEPYLPLFLVNFLGWVFSDAAENHIRMTVAKENKFTSYTELKKHQKRVKNLVVGFFLSLFFLVFGLILQPILLPAPVESELYLPNGKGDIVLGNISKNQATIIFKTLDGANQNTPLATRAIVEVFEDRELTKLVRRTTEDNYAITHIISIDSLQENRTYYVKILARDSWVPNHKIVVSSWGDGGDPITFYTSGEVIPTCVGTKDLQSSGGANVGGSTVNATNNNDGGSQKLADQKLVISNVMSENYLQPQNKIQTIISWNTNKPANTVLIYSEGRSNEKTEIVISDRKITRHAAIMTTLKAGTTYYFNVKSVNENGEVSISEEYSLKTPKQRLTTYEKTKESLKSLLNQVMPSFK